MTTWRIILALLLLTLLGVPLVLPFLDLAGQPTAWQAWSTSGRLFELAGNTLLLTAGTLALTFPLGLALALLLYRSDLPGRGLLHCLLVLLLFVPLPVFASAWQAALGSAGWLPTLGWLTPASAAPWQPWAQGLSAAIWVHAAAALPWVVLLAGQGFRWVERELEEDALLSAPPWRVWWSVTLPRARAALGAAGLCVVVQTATEITVTDLMLVRTFAEEVYTQFIFRDPDVLARAVAVSLPGVLIVAVLGLLAATRWQRTVPALVQLGPPLCLFPLGRARWPLLCVVLTAACCLAAIPLGGLVWKAGLGGSPEVWSAARLERQLAAAFQGNRWLLAENLLLACLAGALAAGLALLACWLAREARWLQVLVLLLATLALALPGPIVGIGLKETIQRLLDVEEELGQGASLGVVQRLLYDGPSLLPVLWASVLRFFPFALAILWPAVRQVPAELIEAARVDGAGPWAELLRLLLPLTAAVSLRAGLAVSVLSLGELSAGKLVETPGATTLAHVIFEQMHRGVPADVAALCLVLLLGVALGALPVGWLTR